jgi:hypothetical protein
MVKSYIFRTLALWVGLGAIWQFGACLGVGFRRVVQDGVTYAGLEFLLDNNAVLDLFTDG